MTPHLVHLFEGNGLERLGLVVVEGVNRFPLFAGNEGRKSGS